MYTHTPLLHRQLREAHADFSLLFTEHDDEADMQAYIYALIHNVSPLFSM